MAVRVAWHKTEQQSVSYIFEGLWNWVELYEAFKQGRGIERSIGHRVDVILQMGAEATPHLDLCDGHYVTNNAFVYALLQPHLR